MGENNNNSCCCNLCYKLLHLIISLGFLALLFWLIYRPTKIKVHVSSASLSQFNLTTSPNSTTLSYNLALNLTIRNPNRHLGFYYDSVDALARYAGSDLGASAAASPSFFFQHHKSTAVVRLEFEGAATAVDAAAVGAAFGRERKEGAFGVEVRVRSRVRVKVMFLRFGRFKPKFDCDLRIPSPTNNGGSSASAFQETQCDVDF